MENELRITMDDYLPLRDVVFKTLRGAILRGDLKPGQRLMEIQLANQLGVSRTPVREAIRMLELEGLVKMVPRKGAEVAQISEKHLRDVLEVRSALEELAGTLACERMNAEQLYELKRVNRQFMQVIDSENITAIADADENFHLVIYNATGNERLSQMVNGLREQMYRYRLEHIKDRSKREELVKEHEAIIRALEERDPVQARDAIRSHIQEQVDAVLELLKRG
ncbi:MAG: GntR family transcriptional regulator [Lachnospiraceae bacterium]|nr:GntR family transcriptional regulator [Lachnospiraceae bacterium]